MHGLGRSQRHGSGLVKNVRVGVNVRRRHVEANVGNPLWCDSGMLLEGHGLLFQHPDRSRRKDITGKGTAFVKNMESHGCGAVSACKPLGRGSRKGYHSLGRARGQITRP